ncbi:MAG: gamma-glutamyl-gamma-aminobutyrate hydrolase family protein [Ignavibacteria bacterium]
MKIGITKSESKFNRCINWLEHFNILYEILDYKDPDEGFKKFQDCRGLLLSGGIDIYPEIYCDWDTVETKGSYSPERDGFELKLLGEALDRKLPVLGICRGLQLMNIYYRGSLIFDLEEIRNVNHKRITPTEDRFHNVKILEGTLLHKIIGKDNTVVTSSHHQAIDRIGEGLMVNAKTNDGVIEGIEYQDKSDRPFFIGVQWHPERFKDLNDPASKNLLEEFINECKDE